MDVTIRRAVPDDADGCAAVHVAAWEGSYRGIMPDEEFQKRPLEVRRKHWKAWLARAEQITLVACDGSGGVLGFVGARLLDANETGFDSYLAMLYVRPELKGRGLGKALLGAMSAELLALGSRTLVLRTLRLNPARGFYERLGARFVPEGVDIEAGTFDDVVYAFDDLERLASPSS